MPLPLVVLTWTFIGLALFISIRMGRTGWARALARGLGILTTASTLAARWIAPAMGFEHQLSLEPSAPFFWITTGLRSFAFAWSRVEASVYFAKAQRRVRTGLMDPVTANRFLLWALWSGSAAAMVTLRTVCGPVRDTQGQTEPPPLAMVMMLLAAGLVCIAAMLLTFQPPGFYTRCVEQRAAAAAA